MTITLPTFTPLEDSLFLTLYARALDNRRPHPILGDAMADQIVRTARLRLRPAPHRHQLHPQRRPPGQEAGPGGRGVPGPPPRRGRARPGRRARHPIRAPGSPGHRGLVRRRLPRGRRRSPAPDPRAPQRARHRRRRDRPGLAGRHPQRPAGHDRGRRPDGVPHPGRAGVAAGTGSSTTSPAARSSSTATPASPSGSPTTPAAPSRSPTSSSSPAWTTPATPKRWNPKLQLVKEILLSREPEVAEFPPAWRLYHRLAAHSTAWSRMGTIVLHYRF